MIKSYYFKFVLILTILLVSLTALTSDALAKSDVLAAKDKDDEEVSKRKIEVTYSFSVAASEGGKARVWIPYPISSEGQEVTGVTVMKTPMHLEDVFYDKEWGNGIFYIEPHKYREGFEFKMRFIVERKEINVDLKEVEVNKASAKADKELHSKYLALTKFGVLNERVKRLSERAVKGKKGDLAKARAIYDFVLQNMEYEKKMHGHGKGDVNRVCLAIGQGSKATGNCTDFHSFFAALMYYQNIPVILEMGYPLKPGKGSQKSKNCGYHCWAKFFIPGKGWIPVDISEAAKDPSKKDYYFGSIDENRISFSSGRDILLVPPQKGGRLDFFGPAPYIEVDGVPFTDFTRTITYRDVE